MTRKDYIILARALSNARRVLYVDTSSNALEYYATALDIAIYCICIQLARDNANFSKDKFLAAIMKED